MSSCLAIVWTCVSDCSLGCCHEMNTIRANSRGYSTAGKHLLCNSIVNAYNYIEYIRSHYIRILWIDYHSSLLSQLTSSVTLNTWYSSLMPFIVNSLEYLTNPKWDNHTSKLSILGGCKKKYTFCNSSSSLIVKNFTGYIITVFELISTIL